MDDGVRLNDGVHLDDGVRLDDGVHLDDGVRLDDGVHLDDGVRLDVCAQRFWADKHQGAFFNIKVFKPYKPSNCKFTTESVYRRHDGEEALL